MLLNCHTIYLFYIHISRLGARGLSPYLHGFPAGLCCSLNRGDIRHTVQIPLLSFFFSNLFIVKFFHGLKRNSATTNTVSGLADSLNIMKISGSWILCLLILTTVILLNFSRSSTSSSIADVLFTGTNGHSSRTTTIARRKLKELSTDEKSISGKVNLDDYHPTDPVPSSKASIRPGPIEHGTPLNPFIPRPSPPSHPKDGGST